MTAESSEADKEALVGVLLRVPVMQEADGRALVLGELADRGFELDAKRYSRDRHDVWAIVSACLRRPGAMAALVEVLHGIDGEHLAVQELSQIVRKAGAGQSATPHAERPLVADLDAELGTSLRSITLERGESASVFPDVRQERLRCSHQLGAGARGKVFGLLNDPSLVYKHYISPHVNGGTLAELILQRNMLGNADRKLLDENTSWPIARVVTDGHVVGCLMRCLPPEFYITTSVGQRPAYLSYLCYPPRPVWERIKLPTVQERIEIARAVVQLVGFLQRYSLVIGDVSAQNLLWTCDPEPRVFLLGCDALRVLGASSALPEGETPGWRDPLLESRSPDFDSDNYKLALVVGRILSREPHARPGEPLRLLAGIPQTVASAVLECFGGAAGSSGGRPTVQDWADALTNPEAPRIRWPEQQRDEAYTVLPIYIVCDLTESESSDISALGYVGDLATVFNEISYNPVMADGTRVCVATFSDQAKVLMPLSDLSSGVSLPPLTTQGNVRRYGPVFTLMKNLIDRDVRNLRSSGHSVMRPVMIFISSGSPTDDWTSSYRELTDGNNRPDIFTWAAGGAVQADLPQVPSKYNLYGSQFSPAAILQQYADRFATSDIQRFTPPTAPLAVQPIDLEYLNIEDDETL